MRKKKFILILVMIIAFICGCVTRIVFGKEFEEEKKISILPPKLMQLPTFPLLDLEVLIPNIEISYLVNNTWLLTKSHLRKEMRVFILRQKKMHLDDKYVENLLDSYLSLISEDGSNVDKVLFFMVMCAIESNFDQNVPTKNGVGIAQVVYKWHKNYIQQLGITKEEFYNSAKHNIFVGFRIFECYYKSQGKILKKAAARYNGGGKDGYEENVYRLYQSLLHQFKKFNNESHYLLASKKNITNY